MNRSQYYLLHWRQRVIPWLVHSGYRKFYLALIAVGWGFECLELTRRMGYIWNEIYYEHWYDGRNDPEESWNRLFFAQIGLNSLMGDITEHIREGIKNAIGSQN